MRPCRPRRARIRTRAIAARKRSLLKRRGNGSRRRLPAQWGRHQRAVFVRAQGRVQPAGRDAARAASADLVLHQRDQRRHHHRHTGQQQRRQLIAVTLPPPVGKRPRADLPVGGCSDDRLLTGAQRPAEVFPAAPGSVRGAHGEVARRVEGWSAE